jgi:hypothetical protein
MKVLSIWIIPAMLCFQLCNGMKVLPSAVGLRMVSLRSSNDFCRRGNSNAVMALDSWNRLSACIKHKNSLMGLSKCQMITSGSPEFDESKFPRPLKGVLFDMDVSVFSAK